MGLFDFLKKGEEKSVVKKTVTQPQKPVAASVPSQAAAPKNPPTTASQKKYTIKSGDSLSKIAKQFYGDANQWSKIHKANIDKIKDPNLIHPGEEIIIP